MYRLDEPAYLYALLLLPLLVGGYLLYRRWQKRQRRAFAQQPLLQRLVPERSGNKAPLKLVLSLLIIALLSVALANPQVGSRLEKVKRKGVDLVFALDISLSMATEDVAPSRLGRAKQIISSTLDRLVADRVGVITYAYQAYPQVPITTDYGAIRLFLRSVSTGLAPVQGTQVKEAVEMAIRYYDDKQQSNRLLLFLTDGENHEGKLEEAIQLARENNITLYTLGIGTPAGAPIPVKRKGKRVGYKKDQAGEVVISRLERGNLQKLAQSSGGQYLDANKIRPTVESLQKMLQKQEQVTYDERRYADFKDQFQWLLAPALLLLVLDALILQRKTRWFKNLKLFSRHD
jgi:Ca-activated chloride channel family protein